MEKLPYLRNARSEQEKNGRKSSESLVHLLQTKNEVKIILEGQKVNIYKEISMKRKVKGEKSEEKRFIKESIKSYLFFFAI